MVRTEDKYSINSLKLRKNVEYTHIKERRYNIIRSNSYRTPNITKQLEKLLKRNLFKKIQGY